MLALACGGAPTAVRGEALFLRGDANADATIDLADAVFTLESLFLGQATPSCPDAADANDDGLVDLSDPIATLGFLFLGGAPLPAPAGVPGTDPTPDALVCAAAGFEEIDLNCSGPAQAFAMEFVIRSQEGLEAALRVLYLDPDAACDPPAIDFTRHTLLGNMACGSGCSREFVKEVERDDAARRVTFRVRVVEHGFCEPYACGNQWVLVPAIPDDFEVLFAVTVERGA